MNCLYRVANSHLLFVTGTDTGVGKTIFVSTLALAVNSTGKKVAIIKPVQTGSSKDTELIKKLTGGKIPVFNTYSFKLPSAPTVAAKHQGKKIKKNKIISDIKALKKRFDFVIVEGIGGIAVPITENYLVADLIKELKSPLITVSSPKLGTINHTVLTLEFAKRKGLNVIGFVISGFDEKSKNVVEKTADEEISKITKVKCLFKIPKLKKINYKSIKALSVN